jgi:hypothetical protein
LRGVVFQSDARSAVGAALIRPLEALDRWAAGVGGPRRAAGAPPLAIHAGLHVVLADGQEVVAEQLIGTPYEALRRGLVWTPLERFRARDRGGWDVTVPATAFRGVDAAAAAAALARLNREPGRPFVREDCTAFVERTFGGRRLFADSPALRALGLRWRAGDPALPLLRPDAALDARARRLLRVDALAGLPAADPAAPGGRAWRRPLRAVAAALVVGLAAAAALRWARRRRGPPRWPRRLGAGRPRSTVLRGGRRRVWPRRLGAGRPRSTVLRGRGP